MVAAIGIVVILAAFAIGGFRNYLPRYESARCMGNLRNLHVALSSEMQDQKQWPQLPTNVTLNSQQEYDWWIEKLLPYGMEKKSWICPTISRMVREKRATGNASIHYLPTPFDEKPMTPFQWPDMPWATEVADMHNVGVLRLYSDGSIRPFNPFEREVPVVKPVP